MAIALVDTHTHLNFQVFSEDWQQVVERSIEAQVKQMLVVGTDITSSKRAIKLAESNPALYAAVGIHPHHVQGIQDLRFTIQDLRKLAQHPKVVAIGEVGLDYHVYTNSKYQTLNIKNDEKLKNLQKQLMGMQVQLAKELNKPMILHSREAGNEVLDVIEHFSKIDGKLPQGVFHCFEGNKKYLQQILARGFYVGFTGNITYAADRARVAQEVPLNRLLLETDCPYMAPVSQGEVKSKFTPRVRSEPANVTIIAQFHAKRRGLKVLEIAKQTTKNARYLFQL